MSSRSRAVQPSAVSTHCILGKLLISLVFPAVVAVSPGTGSAQVIGRPADDRPQLPAFESPDAAPLLPPLERPSLPQERLSVGPGVRVEGYRIEGSTVFSDEELQAAVAEWTGREIRSEDLILVRNAITNLYVDAGYVNSGAVLPDQDFEGGTIELRVIEGTLGEIRIRGNEQFTDHYLDSRIRRAASTPLKAESLARELQIIQQNPRIDRLAARLVPGSEPGTSILYIEIAEASRWNLDVRSSNYEPPSIGAYGGQFDGELGNLVGWGDSLRGIVSVTEGLRRYHGFYEIPVTRFDTRLSFEARYAKARVVESPFDDLDIESRFYSYEVGLHQPVYQSPRSVLEVGVVANWRRTRTDLLGASFSFPGTGADDGEATAMVMRFITDFVSRDARQVFAARSQVSWGIDALGATIHNGKDAEPDGEFVSWLLQLQWARRFPWFGIETVFRTDLQISNEPLLTMEQIAVGGYSTVRGYRQNQVVSDQAVVSSAEIRVPIWSRPELGGTIALAPFVDYAHVWDQKDRLLGRTRNLASIGIGLRWDMPRYWSARLYWGHNLTKVDTSGDLQDNGLQFLVNLSFR